MRSIITGTCLLLLLGCTKHTVHSDAIRLNQIGYYPNASKRAIVVDSGDATDFEVIQWPEGESVMHAKLSESIDWELSGESVKLADFDEVVKPGSYQIVVKGVGYSHPFEIRKNVLQKAFKAAIKGQYYQRASIALDKANAGQWARKMGHPDDSVVYHPSTGKSGFTSAPKGWYDAGDYGKYVVNGALSLGQMMTFFEQYPDAILDGDLNLPESGNGLSDLLDEFRYELEWLLSMQDDDGGLFFKLTTKGFEAMIMPEDAVKTRFIIGKSTAASLDFAAVMAKAYRLFVNQDAAFAKNCLEAAEKAWNWADKNPEVVFKNPEDISTGEYGDANFFQERYWAAAELYLTTQQSNYHEYLESNMPDFTFTPGESWANFMHYLGAFALIDNLEDDPLSQKLKESVLAEADRLSELSTTNAYFQPVQDFQWGSNSDVLNTAMIVAQAYRIKRDARYLNAVTGIADYIFGKNATGYSFLTGFGDKTPMYVHHRPSSADGIMEPVPGLLSGGPNSRQQDKHDVNYPEDVAPMKSWMDVEPSFASNEVCLNWNSAAVYVLGFLEQQETLVE